MTVRASDPAPGVRLLTLADPARRNPLGFATIAALAHEIARAATDGARVVVLSADGAVFSAGADLADLTGTADDVRYDDAIAGLAEAIDSSPTVVVAALDGPCIGAAVDLVLSCDLVVASSTTHLEIPATRLGILYNPSAVARLHGRIGGATLRALLLGVRLDAQALAAAGVTAATAPAGGAQDAALAIAGRIANGVAPAVAATKGLLRDLDRGDVDLEQWDAIRLRLLSSPERHAALEAARNRTRRGT